MLVCVHVCVNKYRYVYVRMYVYMCERGMNEIMPLCACKCEQVWVCLCMYVCEGWLRSYLYVCMHV